MKVKIEKRSKLENRLNIIKRGSQELSRTNKVSFGDLFPDAFMRRYTKFPSIEMFFKAGGFKVKCQADLEAISDKRMNKHIAATTKFKNWEEMLGEAASEYAVKKLGV